MKSKSPILDGAIERMARSQLSPWVALGPSGGPTTISAKAANAQPLKPELDDEPGHTPGEWRVVRDECPTTSNRWLVEKRHSGWKTLIAQVYGDPDHQGGKEWQGDRESNARLIAAAPELLAALLELHECSPCQNGCALDDMTCASNKALAAIAKATGAKGT